MMKESETSVPATILTWPANRIRGTLSEARVPSSWTTHQYVGPRSHGQCSADRLSTCPGPDTLFASHHGRGKREYSDILHCKVHFTIRLNALVSDQMQRRVDLILAFIEMIVYASSYSRWGKANDGSGKTNAQPGLPALVSNKRVVPVACKQRAAILHGVSAPPCDRQPKNAY